MNSVDARKKIAEINFIDHIQYASFGCVRLSFDALPVSVKDEFA